MRDAFYLHTAFDSHVFLIQNGLSLDKSCRPQAPPCVGLLTHTSNSFGLNVKGKAQNFKKHNAHNPQPTYKKCHHRLNLQWHFKIRLRQHAPT